ncbi:RloB family protein, partial [Clostridium sp. BL-8]
MGIKRNIGEVSREKRRKRKVKPLVLIVSEGKDTEINYFKQFNQKYVNVDVKPVDKNSAGKNKSRKTDPSNLVDKAIEY